MDLPLLNSFLELILDYRPCCQITNDRILECIKTTPGYDKCWHIEDNTTVWRKKEWLDSEKRKEQARADKVIFDEALHARREAFFNLCKSIISMLELGEYTTVMDDKHQRAFVYRMAEKFIKNKSTTAEQFFGVDITNLPELPSQVIVLNEKGKKEYEV